MTTVANTAIATPAIEDVQNRLDTRQIVIQKVGIKSIKHPIYFQNVDGHKQHTIATFDLAVNLAAHLKGTHMSRFVELIHELNGQFGVVELQNLLKKMLTKMQAEQGYIDVSFPYFRTKQAPVSQVSSSLDYQVTLHGEIHHGITAIQYLSLIHI